MSTKSGSVSSGGNKTGNVGNVGSVSDSKSGVTSKSSKSSVKDNSQFVGGSFNAKVGFNQADVVKANLARAVSPLDSVSEARLAKVNPELASRVRAMASDLKAQGITVRVTDGLRTVEEQNNLYAQGRTKPGSIVTRARGGSSFHNYGLAVDLVPMVNGKANYNVSADTWKKIGDAGKKYGLEWGGDFKSIVDKPHFQMSGGGRARDLLPTYNQGGLQAVWDKVNGKTPSIGTLPPTPATPPTTRTNPTTTGTTTPATRTTDSLGHLEKGSRGAKVKDLQDMLVKLGYMTKAEMNTGPGIFGPRTQRAVERFQAANGLKTDGVVGPKTRAALGNAATRNNTAVEQVAPTPTNPTATTVSAARINDILKGTNLAGKGELISNLANKYNIPAELALAMFRKEAGFASTGSLAQRNNNPGNIRFRNQEGAVNGAKNFAKWDSMDKGIEAYFKLLDKGYRSFIDNKDWSGLVNKYAPPVENDSRAYTNDITKWMNDYRNRIN
jgi:peptidoglycan hydrolase-like protein with peptidoglycan-binding domain